MYVRRYIRQRCLRIYRRTYISRKDRHGNRFSIVYTDIYEGGVYAIRHPHHRGQERSQGVQDRTGLFYLDDFDEYRQGGYLWFVNRSSIIRNGNRRGMAVRVFP